MKENWEVCANLGIVKVYSTIEGEKVDKFVVIFAREWWHLIRQESSKD